MSTILHLKKLKHTDARDEFDAQREKWKREPLPQGTHEEPFDGKLWWTAVFISLIVFALVLIPIALWIKALVS